MFCKTEFHPAAFAVWEVGVRAGHCARGGPERRPGWRSRSVACRGAWRVGGEHRVGDPDSRLGRGEVGRGPAAAAACSGAAAARSVLSVCWQEAPAHAVLVNIQTRDFSQSKSTSTFFENLPKNSKRREFLAPSPRRRRSKFAT